MNAHNAGAQVSSLFLAESDGLSKAWAHGQFKARESPQHHSQTRKNDG